MSGAVHISGVDQFKKEVVASSIPVLVDFFAEWCGPCQMAGPIMDKLATEMVGKAKIVKIDIDDPANRELAQQHGVMSIPTVLVYQDGKEVPNSKQIGFIGEEGYRSLLKV